MLKSKLMKKELTNDALGKIIAVYMPALATFDDKDKGPYAIQGVSITEGMALFEWDDDSD